jgi:hypothetical protein
MEQHTARRLAKAAFYVALAVAILGAIALPAWAGETRALLTIADGPVQVLRGAQRFDGAEGMALADDDIVRTTATTHVARIEFGDGRALDLGPATQLMLLSPRAAQAQGWPGAAALALQGWVKLSAGTAAARLVLPQAQALTDARGVALVYLSGDDTALAFAESGGLTLLPRGAAGGADLLLREGETWSRDGASGAVRVSARAAGLREMPRALADTLPRRAASFDGRSVDAADGVPLDAADLAAWQEAAPQLLAALRPAAATRVTPARRPGSAAVARHRARTLPPTLLARTPVNASASIELAPTPLLTAETVARSAPALPLH